MKEATGELNMTIVTVVVIGLILAAATLFMPAIIDVVQGMLCTNAGGTYNNSTNACTK